MIQNNYKFIICNSQIFGYFKNLVLITLSFHSVCFSPIATPTESKIASNICTVLLHKSIMHLYSKSNRTIINNTHYYYYL